MTRHYQTVNTSYYKDELLCECGMSTLSIGCECECGCFVRESIDLGTAAIVLVRKVDTNELFRRLEWDIIAWEMLGNWDGGEKLYIYADGGLIRRAANENAPNRAIACLITLGVHSLDLSDFGAIYCEEKEEYINSDGESIGTAFDVVAEYIENSDITEWVEDWKNQISDQLEMTHRS